VVAPGDEAAMAAAEAYRRCLCLPGAARIVAPTSLQAAPAEKGALVIFCSDVGKYLQLDMAVLQQCLEKLRPGGFIIARLGGVSKAEASQLETTGLFAGAVDSRLGDQLPMGIGFFNVHFSCMKPSWATGAAAAVPGAGAAAERINEDDLLGDVPAPIGKGKNDCSSQPKACANCSCGRKELEDELGAEEATKGLRPGKNAQPAAAVTWAMPSGARPVHTAACPPSSQAPRCSCRAGRRRARASWACASRSRPSMAPSWTTAYHGSRSSQLLAAIFP